MWHFEIESRTPTQLRVHWCDHVLRRIPSMRATTFTKSGNTQFFKGKEQVNWGEVYILYCNWRLSPAYLLSTSEQPHFSQSLLLTDFPIPQLVQGPWPDLPQCHCSFFVPGESRAGLGRVSLELSRGEESLPLTWWQHNSQHRPGVCWSSLLPGPRLPHAQLAQSMAELLSCQLAPASPSGWAFCL